MNPEHHRDQPKPTTGEWTYSPTGDIFYNGEWIATAFTYVQGKACVDVINAALAAERGTTDPATGEIITKPSWAELGAMNQELQQLREQLRAEREKVQTLVDALMRITNFGGTGAEISCETLAKVKDGR